MHACHHHQPTNQHQVDVTRQNNCFVLGPRIKVLDDLSGFMPVTVEEAAAEQLRIEFLLRSFLKRIKETVRERGVRETVRSLASRDAVNVRVSE
jgi:hypothetical protein